MSMDLYYINSDDHETGKHKIHKLGCDHFPLTYVYLGLCSTAGEALEKAKVHFPRVEPCPECCKPQRKKVFFDRG